MKKPSAAKSASWEEPPKCPDDPIHFPHHLPEIVDHVHGTGNIAERYLWGEINLHLHITRWRGDGVYGDYCIMFEAWRGLRDGERTVYRSVWQCPSGRVPTSDQAFNWDSDGEKSVLICRVKVLNGPEGRFFWVPSTVRLLTLNQCPRNVGNVLNAPLAMLLEFVGIIENREHGLAVARVRASQFPRNEVQCRAQIVNTIADPESELHIRKRLGIVELEQIASVLRVWLDHNSIRFAVKEGTDSLFDRISMALGTRTLRYNSFELRWPDECHK